MIQKYQISLDKPYIHLKYRTYYFTYLPFTIMHIHLKLEEIVYQVNALSFFFMNSSTNIFLKDQIIHSTLTLSKYCFKKTLIYCQKWHFLSHCRAPIKLEKKATVFNEHKRWREYKIGESIGCHSNLWIWEVG